MKVDKRNPRHWLYLVQFSFNVALALLVRPFRRRRPKKSVILYGHKLAGNLLALQRELRAYYASDFDVRFLTMDPAYFRKLKADNEACLLATSPACIAPLARADVIVSDHGLHALWPMLSLSDASFFDVWHGFGFKGFDADDYRTLHRYDEVWVASETQREQYIEMAEFDPAIVRATGYGRTDALIRHNLDANAIKRELGLDTLTCGRLILFAPTWQQDDTSRDVFPFGMQAEKFLDALDAFAWSMQATVLLRLHLNSSTLHEGEYSRVVQVPYAEFPDTEAILFVCDALICDWSSIAFDFLLLDRPTLFLDVPAPFRKGHSLGPECRFGPVVRGMDELLEGLRNALADPQGYWSAYGQAHLSTKQYVWGSYADGNATGRYVERLLWFR